MLKFRGRALEKRFEEYVITNEEIFYRLAFSYVKNQHDAKDILQESILKAYSNLSKLKEVDALDKWMKRIIINTALDFIRKNSKTTLIEKEEGLIQVAAEQGDKELTYVVDTLEPELKTIIILKYYHGYTIDEVADILEISASTVKNRMHKALKLLRLEVKEG